MNADKMFWEVLARGQRVMAEELLFAARNARSAEEVRRCVDLANKCALIETSCREKASEKCEWCGRPLVFASCLGSVPGDGSTSWLVCPVCG